MLEAQSGAHAPVALDDVGEGDAEGEGPGEHDLGADVALLVLVLDAGAEEELGAEGESAVEEPGLVEGEEDVGEVAAVGQGALGKYAIFINMLLDVVVE